MIFRLIVRWLAKNVSWKWIVCGMLFLALVLNYMDRQVLSQAKTEILNELKLKNEQYGQLELGFGMAFALGAIVHGILADRLNIRWLYPAVLVGWSLAGIATAYADRIGVSIDGWLVSLGALSAPNSESPELRSTFIGFLVCRVTLGFFEAGQWPCALVTTQRLLTREYRSFGNSLLQSGASIGAIATPAVMYFMVTDQAGTWRMPFLVVGALGFLWVVPWFLLIGPHDLDRVEETTDASSAVSATVSPSTSENNDSSIYVRYGILIVVVIAINTTWQYFRVWLPSWLREFHKYERSEVYWFTIAYYVATDVGCIASGAAVKWLVSRGRDVHRARMLAFSVCALLTALSVVAANLPRGPLLLGILLIVAFGSLGLFPHYYAFTQELSSKHQGKMTGSLGAITWIVTSQMHPYVGKVVDETKSYSLGIMLVGLAPLLACIPLWLFWNSRTAKKVA